MIVKQYKDITTDKKGIAEHPVVLIYILKINL